ncbi:MAG TPA: HAD family hydrolase [Candidatus Cybelea sp.]|jgi:phosphoserine phosphatase|nr:HAD family hydrolase [Candidatus Cybelea sp.]
MTSHASETVDALPSWNEGETKQSLIDFVRRTTTQGSPEFVPVHERIALFDNDGTLWVEQPMYTQLAFVLDDVKRLAPSHPEWQTEEPFKSVLADDMAGVAATGPAGLMKLLGATQTGMSTAEFARSVSDWIASARHPRFKLPYTQCIYQPMLELMRYLRANDFKTYIVTGGGTEFVRPWAAQTYGVPVEQVVGSSLKTTFEMRDGKPVLIRTPEIYLLDDGLGKPVGIHQFIGAQPIAAFGNSDGDLQMLEWTAAGDGARLMLIVHHTDGEREYAYDSSSTFGRLDKALPIAQTRGWTVVDMKRDWKTVFAP